MGTSDFSLALRNTLRHRTRSVVALVAIAFSVISLLLAGGFIQWVFWAIEVATIETGLGHIQVVRPDYLEAGTADPFSYLLPEHSADLSAIEGTPHVKVVAPRLNFSGLISHQDTTLSFIGEGVDADKEAIVSDHLRMSRGTGLSEQALNEIIVGEGLAANLGINLGDKVVLLTTSASGGMNAVECSVRGFFSTRFKSVDDNTIRIPIKLARQLLRASGSHIWVVSLDGTDHTAMVLEQLRSRFKAAKLQFVPWFDLADFYNKTVTLLSSQMVVVQIIIGVIIVLSISNMLIMNLMERTGEIGTLMALGARRAKILKLFFSEGLLLALIGGASGLVIGLLLAKIISAIGIPMPPPPGRSVGYSGEILVTGRLLGGAFALAVGTTLFASLYPAWRASRLVIVDALRHNR